MLLHLMLDRLNNLLVLLPYKNLLFIQGELYQLLQYLFFVSLIKNLKQNLLLLIIINCFLP